MRSGIWSVCLRRACAAGIVISLAGCGQNNASTPTAPSPAVSPTPAGATARFEVTFTAADACAALPEAARTRKYSVVTTTADSRVLALAGGSFGRSTNTSYQWNVIYQTPSDNAVTWWFQDPPIWELLGGSAYVVVYGGPVRLDRDAGRSDPRSARTLFQGRFSYCAEMEPDDYPECEVPEITCDSTQHTVAIVRQ
jgi:hypothetical protein